MAKDAQAHHNLQKFKNNYQSVQNNLEKNIFPEIQLVEGCLICINPYIDIVCDHRWSLPKDALLILTLAVLSVYIKFKTWLTLRTEGF